MLKRAARLLCPIGPSLQGQRRRFATSQSRHPTVDKILNTPAEQIEGVLGELMGLTGAQHQLALKLLLRRVYGGQLPLSIVRHPTLAKQLGRHPDLVVDASLFEIKEQMRELSALMQKEGQQSSINSKVQEITEEFIQCFEAFKRIPVENSLRHQVILHKRFGDFNMLYVAKMAQGEHKKAFLKKASEFYESAGRGMAKLIITERKRVQDLVEEQPEQPKPGEGEEEQMKLNSAMESMRTLIEPNAENVYHLFLAQNDLENMEGSAGDKQVFWFHPKLVHLLADVERALSFYKIFGKMTPYSIFYHRLRKMENELRHHLTLNEIARSKEGPKQQAEARAEAWNQLVKSHEELYEKAVEDIGVIKGQPQHAGVLYEVCQILFNLRLASIFREQLNAADFKSRVAKEINAILVLLPNPS